MMEIGIFRKELHEFDMINAGMENQIDLFDWVNLADGKEAVFENSVDTIGFMAIISPYGNLIELAVFRDWCNDFKPLNEF